MRAFEEVQLQMHLADITLLQRRRRVDDDAIKSDTEGFHTTLSATSCHQERGKKEAYHGLEKSLTHNQGKVTKKNHNFAND